MTRRLFATASTASWTISGIARSMPWRLPRHAASCWLAANQQSRWTMVIDFQKAGGLVAAIAQDAVTGQVLMLAWMNQEAFEETVRTGRAVYFSRSRQRLWRKGEESGNVQEVKEVYVDCDADTILLKVHQIGGAACHEGYQSCFFRKLEGDRVQVIGERLFDPKAVYK